MTNAANPPIKKIINYKDQFAAEKRIEQLEAEIKIHQDILDPMYKELWALESELERYEAQEREHTMNDHPPTGDTKSEYDTFVRGYKMALFHNSQKPQLEPCDLYIYSPKHEMRDTGDPCWCGSDNCEVCIKCGAQNHD